MAPRCPRKKKNRKGIKTKYINDVGLPLVQVLMETTDANIVQAVYTYGNDLISMNRADANSYYHYDGLGSTRQLTNSSGDVTVSYMYDSFGNVVASSGATANVYGFTGQQQFGEADSLVFLRARYYKSSIGRFINTDPIGDEGGLNLYAYVENNPINRIDPTGTKGYFSPAPIGYSGECKEIEGYYRHCLYSCRLNRWITPWYITYPIALWFGDDWPWNDDGDINHKRDREGDRKGIYNSYKFWTSCKKSCAKSTEKAIAKYCKPCPK